MKTNKLSWFANVETRPHPWPGLNWLTTALCVTDVQKAVNFYTGAMDMIAISELDGENGELLFARIRYRGTNFVINKEQWDSDAYSPETTHQQPPFIFYLYVDDVHALVGKMKAAGATVLMEATKQFWGDLKARLKDPFGYYWDIAQKMIDPQQMAGYQKANITHYRG